MSNYKIVSPQEVKEKKSQNSVILDVRTDMEHREKCLTCEHIHLPLDQIDVKDFMKKNNLDENSTLYFLCRGGTRAKQAAEKFAAEGFKNLCVIEGGIMACEAQGHEINSGKSNPENLGKYCSTRLPCPSISLERQVRIAAGVIAFIGSLLALTVAPAFALIPLFVGGGLVFAGITDHCGLALVLTKAPWNKINNKTRSQ